MSATGEIRAVSTGLFRKAQELLSDISDLGLDPEPNAKFSADMGENVGSAEMPWVLIDYVDQNRTVLSFYTVLFLLVPPGARSNGSSGEKIRYSSPITVNQLLNKPNGDVNYKIPGTIEILGHTTDGNWLDLHINIPGKFDCSGWANMAKGATVKTLYDDNGNAVCEIPTIRVKVTDRNSDWLRLQVGLVWPLPSKDGWIRVQQ
jgi:hypothetical protein